jgi:hypothetical protein
MKHLDEEWNEVKAKTKNEIRLLEEYIRTPQGAHETVEWLVAMFAFCAIDGLWATYNLWHLLLSAIL